MAECCLSAEEAESRRIHREIEKQLRRDKIAFRREVLMLVFLGNEGSGKSTLIKQMRIIHGSGYSEADRRGFTQLVFQNIVTAIQALIDAMRTLQIDYTDQNNISLVQRLSQVEVNQVAKLETWQADAIRQVWNDQGVQRCYDRGREFQLSDSTKYFLNDLDRITALLYIPTLQDILRVKAPTSGFFECCFKIENCVFKMVEWSHVVRKWMGYLDYITCYLFLADLSEYDQVLYEEYNQMEESLNLFKMILGNRWFGGRPFILFLNKTDSLEEKIAHSHLATFFPAFTGPQGDATSARNFISQMYMDRHEGYHEPIFIHFTCATDTENIRHAFNDVKDTIFISNMSNFNIE